MKKNNKQKRIQKIIDKIKEIVEKIELSKIKFNTLELILVFIMALVFGLLLGEMVFSNGDSTISLTEKTSKEMSEIEKVYNTLLEEYINDVNEEKLKEAAINGMMNLLGDKHSTYYDEKSSEELKEELNGYFYGMGALVSQKPGELVTISEIYENTPAEKAGLKVGDKYLKIDNEDVSKLTSAEIAEKIKGNKSKTLNLTIKREDEEIQKIITTEKVEIPSVTKQILEQNGKKIGYVAISIFANNTDEQFSKKLKELEKENITNMIIDLRYNQGGQLDTVLNISNQLFANNTPVLQMTKKGKTQIKYTSENNNKKYNMVVLMNEGSASGSEVLAAALNEQLNVQLIGTRTYGKGTVQKTKSLPSGGTIKYTIETWKTSKGKYIDGKGIEPTIKIEQSKKFYETGQQMDDVQLQKALKVILK